jgi:hypothetical protein
MDEMASEPQSIDITGYPDLVRLVEEIQASQTPRVLRRDDEDVALLTPVKPKRKRAPRTRPVTEDDPLFRLIGTAEMGAPGGISGKKHEYLAKAYRAHGC